MRILITFLILIFSLQSLTKAEDISDFEIEGMSVGDSLLDYYKKSLVDSEKEFPQWSNKKFTRFVSFKNLNHYDGILFYFEDNGDYLISSISAIKRFPNNIDSCIEQKNQLTKEFKNIYNNYKTETYKSDHQADKTGGSKNIVIDFNFTDGTSSRIICTDWSETMNLDDELRVTLSSKEYTYFITNEAWK